MKTKYLKIKPEDIEGSSDLQVNLENTIDYEYYYVSHRGKIYKVYRYGNKTWDAVETPFENIPYIHFNEDSYE